MTTPQPLAADVLIDLAANPGRWTFRAVSTDGRHLLASMGVFGSGNLVLPMAMGETLVESARALGVTFAPAPEAAPATMPRLDREAVAS